MPSPSQPFLLDKTGREILPGDTLKVVHFIAAGGERMYMHKWVENVVMLGTKPKPFLQISHLGLDKNSHYFERLDGQKCEDIEIVQGYSTDGVCWRDRPKWEPTKSAVDLTAGTF